MMKRIILKKKKRKKRKKNFYGFLSISRNESNLSMRDDEEDNSLEKE